MTGHYFQDWLFHDSDWNWRLEPDKGGALRAVGDIGSHWIDLVQFLTGRQIVAVMADLATFVNARQEPRGPVETFSTERSTDTVTREMATEDVASILVRSTTAPAARSRCPRSAPAGRTRSSGRSTARRERQRGTRRPPTTCGSAIAIARTRSCSGIRR